MRRLIGFLGFLALCAVSFTAPQALVSIVADKNHAAASYTGPCDVGGNVSCAAAYSMTRSMRSAYTGNLFQLHNGTTTLNVGQTNHVVDTSGVGVFCAGVLNGCVISKIYDHSGNGNDLTPVTGNPGIAPAACSAGNACAAPYWVDPSTGLPVAITTLPTEYDAASTGINGGANPTSVFFYGRNDHYPGQFGIGHNPTTADTNGLNFIVTLEFTNRSINGGYLKCSALGAQCLAIDEETSVEPYTVSTAPGGIGATYATDTNGDVKTLITWDGINTVKGYANSSTALFTVTPPSSVQFDASPLVPGTHVKIGCGGDCIHSDIIFREGLVSNATLASTDYTLIANNVDTFYGAHTAAATCRGSADVNYYVPIDAVAYTDWNAYIITGGSPVAYSLAQIRASYFGPLADLNNGTTTQSFSSALAAGSAGCGLDPAAATFCNPSCTIVKLYNQGGWSTASIGNVHDTSLDMVFASGHRPTVTFSSLNGLPTMHFAGNEKGCTSLSFGDFSGYWGFGAVAKRTGGFTSFSNIIDFSAKTQLVWNNSADSFGFYNGTNFPTQAATDSHWHFFYMESNNANWARQVDSTGGASFAAGLHVLNMDSACIGEKSDNSQALTGDIAEVVAISVQSGASVGYTAGGAALLAIVQNTWGTLPN